MVWGLGRDASPASPAAAAGPLLPLFAWAWPRASMPRDLRSEIELGSYP